MKEWYKDFIGIYEEAFPKEYCQAIINIFDNSKNKMDRQSIDNHPKGIMDDTCIPSQDVPSKIQDFFYDKLNNVFLTSYFKKYSHSLSIKNPHISNFKVQKTSPTEGYHAWHSEWGPQLFTNKDNFSPDSNVSRVLVYTLYLNDVREGGETEFLNQSLRISPKEGTLCLFPSYFTHTHRGNPPLKHNKYIVTGWINQPIDIIKE